MALLDFKREFKNFADFENFRIFKILLAMMP